MREKLSILGNSWIGLFLLLAAACSSPGTPSHAKGLCVSPERQGGCYTTIGAAVAAALPGELISVHPGTYREMVSIRKPLTLVGNDSLSQPSTIEARGFDHGFYVSGVDRGPVVIRDFEVRDAGRAGILVENSSQVALESNYIHANGEAADKCPDAVPGESPGCGAGIHLRSVRQSTVLDNELTANRVGLLISDETGASSHNLVAHNTARANPGGCGLVLRSSAPCQTRLGASLACQEQLVTPAFGVFDNVISTNAMEDNGGCGIGIFAANRAAAAFSNTISGNIVRENGAGGVIVRAAGSIHSIRNTAISSNLVSANGAAPEAARRAAGIVIVAPAAPDNSGPHPADEGGITIAQNSITDEQVDVFIVTGSGGVNVFLNDLLGTHGVLGIHNGGAGVVNAMGNYWNCAAGPLASADCSSVAGAVLTTPALPSLVPQPIINLTASAVFDAN